MKKQSVLNLSRKHLRATCMAIGLLVFTCLNLPMVASAQEAQKTKEVKRSQASTSLTSSSSEASNPTLSYHPQALVFYKEGKYKEALDKWNQGVLAGDKDAEHFLGVFYIVGDENMGLKQNPEKALELLKKSANKNQPESQRMLASAYMDGMLVEKDPKKALEWYDKAAKNGSVLAQYDLAGFYLNGQNVEKNEKKALELYEQAAAAGHTQSELVLAAFYIKGEHVKQDKKEALRRFEKLANRLDPQGQFFMAVYKLEEEKDKIEAYKWSKLSLQNKGTRDTLNFFQALKNNMSPQEIAQGEERVKNWKPVALVPSVVKK